jgi:insertion element IS1 protein InsB
MESMIQETIPYTCHACGSANIVRNGTNRCGNAHYHCKDCGSYRVLKPKQAYSEAEKATALRAGLERCSLRGVERIFDIARQRVTRWIATHVQKLPEVKDLNMPASVDDVLELDEIWSFVLKKDRTRWLWAALCRRTRQIVAFVIGDRSKTTCHQLWMAIPDGYKSCQTFSDFYTASRHVFPEASHYCVGKETGETAHRERWNNTLRQRMSRYARQTFSFSKSDTFHEAFTKWFIVEYNRGLSLTT